MNNKVRKIAYAGVFIALSIVLTRFMSQMIVVGGFKAIRISFGEIPLMLSGIILGPWYGLACGALADLIGFPFNAQGAYFPGFTLTAALAGFLPAVIGRLFAVKEWSWLKLAAAVGITMLITSIALNTYWIYLMSGKAAAVLLPPRVIAAAIMAPIYVIVMRLFLKHFGAIARKFD